MSDPVNPVGLGCVGEDGYVHDTECMVYAGPDTRYAIVYIPTLPASNIVQLPQDPPKTLHYYDIAYFQLR